MSWSVGAILTMALPPVQSRLLFSRCLFLFVSTQVLLQVEVRQINWPWLRAFVLRSPVEPVSEWPAAAHQVKKKKWWASRVGVCNRKAMHSNCSWLWWCCTSVVFPSAVVSPGKACVMWARAGELPYAWPGHAGGGPCRQNSDVSSQFKSHQKRRHRCTECSTVAALSRDGELSSPA